MNFFSLLKRKIIYKIKKKINIDKELLKNKSLDELFHHYGSDKANIFKLSGDHGHGFSKFYSRKLKEFEDKKINILEIGSYAGASAAALNKYFPLSQIFCFDINISKFKFTSKKIHVFGLDINNLSKVKKNLRKINEKYKVNNFDLIIDDGSHDLKDILVNLKTFFKYLKKNGLYVIEDFKHPNYYIRNRNIEHILIDELIKNLENKFISNSTILTEEDQDFLIKNINSIEIFKGNLEDSDICFIKKI